jgi:hypothetical protein
LDSICPTGADKVSGVKIEIDKEKWAGGAEVIRLRQGFRRRNAMAGRVGATIWRDKKQSNFVKAQGRDYKVFRGFSRCRSTGQTHGLRSGAPFSAVMNGNAREKTPAVASGFGAASTRAHPPSLKLRRDKKQRNSFDRIHPQSRQGLGRVYFACCEESFFPWCLEPGWITCSSERHYIETSYLLRSSWRCFGFVVDGWFEGGGGGWAKENIVFLQIRRV